jgi:hypothetical protein
MNVMEEPLLTFAEIRARVYSDPELREQMRKQRQDYEVQHKANRAAAEEFERSRPERLKAFWESLGLPQLYTEPGERECRQQREAARRRLLAMPAAEAWMVEHPFEFTLDTCPDQGAMTRLIRADRQRLKATRRILKELGIK